MIYRFLAYLVVVAHIGFAAFVVLGGLWVLKRPRLAWLHLPAVAWAVLIEWAGWICPLTPLENRLRELGGLAGYRGGFLESWLLPALYPQGLGRTEQWLLGSLALVLNLCVYVWVVQGWRRGSGRGKGSRGMSRATGPGPRIRETWERLSRAPGGRRFFGWLLGRMVPYSGTIGARVIELAPGFARVDMPDRRRVRNHLRSIHAVALANLGELCTGLALNVGIPAEGRAILVGIEIEYVKKARGTLTATCRCEIPELDVDRELEIRGEIRDAVGDEVARIRTNWRVGPVR